MNQIFGSATNLLIGFYLVRQMLPAEFGLYNIAFAITITAAAIGNAVFLIPMTVGVPDDDAVARDRWMLEYIAAAALCLGAIGALVLACLSIAVLGRAIPSGIMALGATTVLSCLGFFLKDAMVQAGYNQGRERTTILINVASASSVALLIALGMRWEQEVSAPWAVGGYAISQFCALATGYRLVFAGVAVPDGSSVRKTLGRVFATAFWPASATTLALMRSQAHTIVVAGLIGPAGVAFINATRLLFAPVQMAQPALVRAAMPRLVKQLRTNREAFQRSTIAITCSLALFSVAYCLPVTLAGKWLFPVVIGSKYHYSLSMLLAWSCYLTLVAARSGFELNQQTLQRFKGLAGAGLAASMASLVGAYFLTRAMGPAGAVFGLAAGEVATIAVLQWRMRRGI